MSIRAIAFLAAAYHLYLLGFSPADPWTQRVIHLATVAVLTFFLVPAGRGSPKTRPTVIDGGLLALTLMSGVYVVWNHAELLGRLGVVPERGDVIVGTILVVAVLEMGRRLFGWLLPSIAAAFIVYALIGDSIPGFLGHKGYSFERTITLLLSQQGIYGEALAASATFVTLFVIFGAFLARSGAGVFLVELSQALAGRMSGGPAKVAIVASALFGSVSGSAVSNVVSTGTFTIPLMKSIGYRPEFAGAVEAVASTGGQVMPPVMSATAFVMSEITGIPYLEIALAATAPALLYYVSVWIMVGYEARNLGLQGANASSLPNAIEVLRRGGHLLLPLVVIVYALVGLRVSPLRAALMGIAAAALVSWLRAETRMGPRKIAAALSDGMIGMIDIAVSCALAGIIIGVFSLTGIGLKLATALLAFSHEQIWLGLLLSMLITLILGMGLPTIAAYAIAAAAVAPALVQLGVPLLAAHMFILYFSAISTITPPVAIAAFAAAGIAGASPMRVGFEAVRLGIAAYIVPYMFVYSGALLLRGDFVDCAIAIATALVGVWALAKGFQDQRSDYLSRLVLLVAAVMLIKPGSITDIVGIGLIAVVMMRQRLFSRNVKERAAEDRHSEPISKREE